MRLLCFDLSSGGITAALLDLDLNNARAAEQSWILQPNETGAAALSAPAVLDGVARAVKALQLTPNDSITAVCIGTFMHNCVLLDEQGMALTPLFTWLDDRAEEGVEYVRSRLGSRFHAITGCRYHPMFPVFKLAALRLSEPDVLDKAARIVSIKTILLHALTGSWIEDHGLASASGLLNIHTGDWDAEVLGVIAVKPAQLPPLAARAAVAGFVTPAAAVQYGINAGIPVVVGSGDGFLANIGSDCETPDKIAVTLGTSAVARQTVSSPILSPGSGTFCYRADAGDSYLLGCAGSNGGNVLDWGRRIFANSQESAGTNPPNPPIFIPLLNGERSPDWNPRLTGSWHGLKSRHTAGDLWRSVLEGVVFNLAHFVEILRETSGITATDMVLSGNGFLEPLAGPMLARIAGVRAWAPSSPGLASLRGAGVCALRALGKSVPPLQVDEVAPLNDSKVSERYREYRRLRAAV